MFVYWVVSTSLVNYLSSAEIAVAEIRITYITVGSHWSHFFQIIYTIHSKIMSLLQMLHLRRSKEKVAIARLLCINSSIAYCSLIVHLFCGRTRNITLTFSFPVKYICICWLIRWYAFLLLLLTTVITINIHSEVREVIIFEGQRSVSLIKTIAFCSGFTKGKMICNRWKTV